MSNYYIYIATNKSKKVLYTGVTNDLRRRMYEHEQDSNEEKKSFAGKYNCYHLIYWESFQSITHAIAREKEIKGWTRKKKVDLIASENPTWKFLNDEI
ncbi:MAG: GIY-YIG nuclease family protein [Bacteroidetes bacterium]|nr:GIY-YIG nuclease family protein [Bacteroidota bacterium]